MEDEEWTKKELTLRPGIYQLACAVIEQWKLDGCPKCDTEAIRYWARIIEEHERAMEKHNSKKFMLTQGRKWDPNAGGWNDRY